MKTYDFVISWPDIEKTLFLKWLKEECISRKLVYVQCHDGNISEIIEKIEENKLKINFLLDMNSTLNNPGDLYTRLSYAVKDSGGMVVDDPDYARVATDKSISHYNFINHDIPVPFTIIIRSWQLDRIKVPDEIKKKLGIPFIIKPAQGFSGKGVIMDANWKFKNITKARNFDRTDNYLLQEKVNPINFDERPAWFRVFYLFGEIIPCWWNPFNSEYTHANKKDAEKFNLSILENITLKIVNATSMEWFTTEIAFYKNDNKINPVVVDYVNDQCHVDTKSEFPHAPPDHIVKHIAFKMVEAAYLIKKNKKNIKEKKMWVLDNNNKL